MSNFLSGIAIISTPVVVMRSRMARFPSPVFTAAILLAALPAPSGAGEPAPDCTLSGAPLFGDVQVVDSFPDIKVQVVDSFPDLRVKIVDSFPDECGAWRFVDSFPDLKIQYVDSFPDLKIQFVDSFPGLS